MDASAFAIAKTYHTKLVELRLYSRHQLAPQQERKGQDYTQSRHIGVRRHWRSIMRSTIVISSK